MTTWRPMGDRAWRAPLPAEHDPHAVLSVLRAIDGVRDVVLSETHALVCVDAPVPHASLAPPIALPSLDAPVSLPSPPVTTHVVAVRYDGPDLDDVAAHTGLSRDAVIARHTAVTYTVLAMGFLPGFAYLGPLDSMLHLPRRAAPRPKVVAGSVGIAGDRTGVYPFASPGGWHLLGHTVDFTPFSPTHGARWQLGDRVRFEAR